MGRQQKKRNTKNDTNPVINLVAFIAVLATGLFLVTLGKVSPGDFSAYMVAIGAAYLVWRQGRQS